MMQKQWRLRIYIEEVKQMKRIYSAPAIGISYFELENVVTLSGDGTAATASDQLKQEMGDVSVTAILQWTE